MTGTYTKGQFDEAMRLTWKHGWLQRDRFNIGLRTAVQEAEEAGFIKLVDKLLEHFRVLTSRDIDELSALIAQCIESELPPETTLVVATSEDSKPDGSEIIINTLKAKLSLDWQGRLSNTFNTAFKQDKAVIKNYVIVDDFVGTGEKMRRRVQNLSDHLSRYGSFDARIFVACYAGMHSGIESLVNHPAVSCVYPGEICRKGISECLDPFVRPLAKDAMDKIEARLMTLPGKYQYGYGGSESLIWIEGFNIPNNVFPFFWWEKYWGKDELRLNRPALIPRR